MRPNQWGTSFFPDGQAFWALCAPNVGPPRCLRAGGDESELIFSECGLLATFGECQVMAQIVAARLLVFPLIKESFRACDPLLNRGNFASVNPNHQKWPRAEWH